MIGSDEAKVWKTKYPFLESILFNGTTSLAFLDGIIEDKITQETYASPSRGNYDDGEWEWGHWQWYGVKDSMVKKLSPYPETPKPVKDLLVKESFDYLIQDITMTTDYSGMTIARIFKLDKYDYIIY
ncbi:MAG: hypothetical protein ACP5OA_07340 [Candidatus Woesearchaeota archaeon]